VGRVAPLLDARLEATGLARDRVAAVDGPATVRDDRSAVLPDVFLQVPVVELGGLGDRPRTAPLECSHPGASLVVGEVSRVAAGLLLERAQLDRVHLEAVGGHQGGEPRILACGQEPVSDGLGVLRVLLVPVVRAHREKTSWLWGVSLRDMFAALADGSS
jgi:hypothetical protein